MNHDEFLAHVQRRCQLASRAAAVGAIRAVLQTLAERLGADESRDLAARLPREVGQFLREAPRMPIRYSLDQVFELVAEREGADLPAAVYHARVVLEVLQEAVGPAEIADVVARLPAEFRQLFASGSGAQLGQ